MRLTLRRLLLAYRRRQLREIQERLRWVRDQIHSGRIVERQLEAREARLYAEVAMLQTPRDIVRGAIA